MIDGIVRMAFGPMRPVAGGDLPVSALGNVIGSNLFDLLGITGPVGPSPVNARLPGTDLWVMLASAVILWPIVFRGWPLARAWGAGLSGAHAVDVDTQLH